MDRILEALRSATLGEYDIAGELGRGGMAVVFLAHDMQLNRRVAIKALLPELLYTDGMDLRFKQEARVAAKLDHPNILVIYGVRESKDLLYIVTKLVDGRPLSAEERSQYAKSCVGAGASRGGNPKYAAAARERVKLFVIEHFKLQH